VGEDESADRKRVGQLLLGGSGVLLAAAGMWAFFAGQDDELAGGFFVLTGLLMVVLAAFYSHVDGIVELGLLKIPIAKARRAEKQLERGRIVAGSNLEEARKALEEALSRYHDAQFGTPTVTQDPSASRDGPERNVLLVEDAVFTMATLTLDEQALVRTEVARMRRPDFHTNLDLRETRPGNTGRSYRMHRVPDSDLRLWYRQKSEFEPYPLVVMVIEDTGKDR
jgi:hypothetical protein